MNKQMERLYTAAKLLKNIAGQSALARVLNESPQTIKNWESRGVSKGGMIKAQSIIGCSAVWIETESGSMTSDIPIRDNEFDSKFRLQTRQRLEKSNWRNL